mgnify:CR=1 FL=1
MNYKVRNFSVDSTQPSESKEAGSKGKIKTLLGRRCRFPKYEPVLRGDDWGKYVPEHDLDRMLELKLLGQTLLLMVVEF